MCLKIKSVIFPALVLLLFLSVLPVQADILYDHFDGSALDPAWTVETSSNVTSLSYDVSRSKLNVTNLTSGGLTSSGSKWATVTFSQDKDDFTPLSGDFSFDFDFSWNSKDLLQTAQRIYLYLYSGGTVVAQVGYLDGYGNRDGTYNAYSVATKEDDYFNAYYDAYDTITDSTDASVVIERTDGQIDISWNGRNLTSGYSNLSIDKVALEFGAAYGYSFGAESVDKIADPVPEPSTMLLLGFGLLGLAGLRGRIKKS